MAGVGHCHSLEKQTTAATRRGRSLCTRTGLMLGLPARWWCPCACARCARTKIKFAKGPGRGAATITSTLSLWQTVVLGFCLAGSTATTVNTSTGVAKPCQVSNASGGINWAETHGGRTSVSYPCGKPSHKKGHVTGGRIQKRIGSGVWGWNGLKGTASMTLETAALLRIEKRCGPSGHFPRLLAINAHFFTTTTVGCPIDSTCMTRVRRYEGYGFGQSPIAMASAVLQIESILRCLRLSEIRHLDLKCRNMAISSSGTLGLFDYDISVMDGNPKSEQLKSRFNRHRRIHDYEQHARRRFKLCLGYVDTSTASYENDRRLYSV